MLVRPKATTSETSLGRIADHFEKQVLHSAVGELDPLECLDCLAIRFCLSAVDISINGGGLP